MNEVVKKLWIEALLSKRFKQGFGGRLHKIEGDEHCFCPLGVLCEVAVEQKIIKPSRKHPSLQDFYIYGRMSSNYLPHTVVKWAQLDNDNPTIRGRDLSQYNDHSKLKFDYIAKLIEEYL